jgi:hypothetical protein
VARNESTLSQLSDRWLDDDRDSGRKRICGYCGDVIVVGDDRYIVDSEHIHSDCWRAWSVAALDAVDSTGGD